MFGIYSEAIAKVECISSGSFFILLLFFFYILEDKSKTGWWNCISSNSSASRGSSEIVSPSDVKTAVDFRAFSLDGKRLHDVRVWKYRNDACAMYVRYAHNRWYVNNNQTSVRNNSPWWKRGKYMYNVNTFTSLYIFIAQVHNILFETFLTVFISWK